MSAIAMADLRLEPLWHSHAAEMYTVLGDERIWERTGRHAPASVEALTADYRRWESRMSPDGLERWLNWIVRRTTDNAALGFVQATIAGTQAEIAYVFGRSAWGRGYARAAVAAMLPQPAPGLWRPDNCRPRRCAQRPVDPCARLLWLRTRR